MSAGTHHHGPLPTIEGPIVWTDAEKAEIAEIIARYPARRAATLPLLWKAQRKWGWLSLDVIRLVAESVGTPPSEVLAVASFYTMFKKEPTGRYLIQVCHTLSCQLGGSERVVAHLKSALGIVEGETTPDGLFTLMRVECLASCGSAPMMQINDDFYERLTPEKLDEIVGALRRGQPLPLPRPEVEEWHWTNPS